MTVASNVCRYNCVLSKEDDLALAMGLEFDIEDRRNDGLTSTWMKVGLSREDAFLSFNKMYFGVTQIAIKLTTPSCHVVMLSGVRHCSISYYDNSFIYAVRVSA